MSGRSIESKKKREKYKIDDLLDRQEQEKRWDFYNPENKAVDEYRRQMVPWYLLNVESNQYPVYVNNEDFEMGLMTGGENFERPQSSTTIENIKINMSESVSTNLAFDLKNISLLTTADQLIKICERKIRK